MSTVESQPVSNGVRLLVVMGSSGCGKSTIGTALSERLNAEFIEGDDHHTPENKLKMANSIALTDDDRWPWLKRLSLLMRSTDGTVVASCSALKKSYRQYITDCADESVLFIYLHGSSAVLTARLAQRKEHFMSRALLESQLAALEVPAADELSITVDIDQPIDAVVDKITQLLDAKPQ